MTTYPLATLACTIDATGISAPAYADVLESLKASYRSIYGSDVYLEADSQDGQLLAIFAAAINDCNAATIATYNQFSPTTAQGAGLSSVVKVNGIARDVATHSTADVTITGTAGAVISNGQIADAAGTKWALPATVTIGLGGSVVVTATAVDEGAITADAGSLTKIVNPSLGWLSVTNVAAATPGAPVEQDAALRQRQAASVALPAVTALEAIVGAVSSVHGVERLKPYENDTGTTDGDGIPAHSISLVVQGGDASAIAAAIALKKTPGGRTYGSTSQTVTDAYGVAHTIRFYRPTAVPISVSVSITALTGYTSVVGDAIKAAVVAYINALDIGADVLLTRLYVPANLSGSADGQTFEVSGITLARDGGGLAASDVVVAFNEAATCVLADVALVVT